MGTGIKKQFLTLAGEPVLVHTLRILSASPEIETIILVVPENEIGFCKEEIINKHQLNKVGTLVAGGEKRQDSVAAGLKAIEIIPECILVHDGVRPFLTPGMISETIRLARQGISSVVGVPVSDTVKTVNANGSVIETMDRRNLWSIQTPQAFPYTDLIRAFDQAEQDGFYGTDEASLVERLGIPVRVVMGRYENIKITTPSDLILGEAIMIQESK